ncbi:MAG: insulinase family protein [Polyangiaceae bacterium]|nr:insulinase family protein [Polyangiaceae bacterium]
MRRTVRGGPAAARPPRTRTPRVAEVVRHDRTLPNGLDVVLVPRPALHHVAVSLFVRTGSRFEHPRHNGISHLLEHMLFRGTRRLPSAHAQARAFEALGGTLDAATAVDHGSLSLDLPPASLAPALALLAETVLAPCFSELGVERRIVRQEILQDLDEHGEPLDEEERLRGLAFGRHPLARPIAGTLGSLRRFDLPLLRAEHRRHYCGANGVLCIAGRLGAPDACAALVGRTLGRLPSGRRVPTGPPPAPQRRPRALFLRHPGGTQTTVRLGFRAPALGAPDEPAAAMLLRVLDDGLSTRLYERLCDRRGLCYDVSADYDAFEDAGLFAVEASTDHAQAPRVLAEMLAALDELRQRDVTGAELATARARHGYAVGAMRDDPAELCEFFGLSALLGVTRSPRARHAELCSVEAEDLRAAAARIFVAGGASLLTVGGCRAADERRMQALVEAF